MPDGEYITYPCSHGYDYSHEAEETCSTCQGTGQKTSYCAHNVSSSHRYCSHYNNTTLTTHKYCSHGQTSEHD